MRRLLMSRLIRIFTVCLVSSASVDLIISVLQYDNPSGTSYTGMNSTGGRKCCDAGSGSAGCGLHGDTCDVLFAFCLGILDDGNNCNGSYIGMSEDVQQDTDHLNDTQRKSLVQMSSMAWWDQDNVNLTANVFDVDSINKTSGTVDSELVDFFNQPLNITPAASVVEAQDHVIILQHSISLSLSIKVWCSAGWYGALCDEACNDTLVDDFHVCSSNGSVQVDATCSSKDLLVLSLEDKLLDVLPLYKLQRQLVEFIAINACPRKANTTSVSMHNVKYRSDSPTESHVDFQFYGYCGNKPVSRIKFMQTVFILNQYPLNPGFPTNLFNAPVASPKLTKIGSQHNKTVVYFMVQIVKFEILNSNVCENGSLGELCYPEISLCLQSSLCETVSTFHTNSLTDCNGVLVDVNRSQQSGSDKYNSTALFSLSTFPGYMLATVQNNKIGSSKLASFNISFANLHAQLYFSRSFPVLYTESTKTVRLVLEIMAWCGAHSYGGKCNFAKPAGLPGIFEPACSKNSECQNNGFCRNKVCICASGWTGATCKIDIDECSLGTCMNSYICQNTMGGYICNCTQGFNGKNCDQDINECETMPCHNGSTCLNTYGGYTCLCAPFFKGSFCNETDYCNQNICSDNADYCSESNGNYSCACKAGWNGRRCYQDINECLSSPCANGSSLECLNIPGSFTCRCKPGYIGNTCENYNECKVFRPCQNGGRCYNVPNGHFCNCPPDWTGQNCTVRVVDCKQNPCHNNGTCLEVLGGGFKCTCLQGWTGKHCTQNVDECTRFDGHRLCNFHGACIDNDGGYTCSCNRGWTGQYCSKDLLECEANPCFNNGTCTNQPGGFRCDCAKGWGGDTCKIDKDECYTLNPCQNSGTCINLNGSYECICTDSWDGRNCTLDIDECLTTTDICSNGGTCMNTQGSFYCSCPPGWQGNLCTDDKDECTLSKPCLHSGTCVNTQGSYKCDCTSTWTGLNCSDNVDECSQYPHICVHGTCADTIGGYNCSCFLGWQGQNCSDDVDECKNFDACSNYSICENTFNGYHCNCVNGWTGTKCDVNINECASNPCQHGGTCIDRDAYFKCICPNTWDGLNCEIDINECDHHPCTSTQICHNHPGSYLCEDLSTSTVRTSSRTSTSATSTSSSAVTTSTVSSTSTTQKTTTVITSTPTASTASSSSTSISSSSTSSAPVSVDVFSLQFVSPVAQADLPAVRDGIHAILKLLNCHDSAHIYVSLVHNSITNPKTVEFHAQCDGHHLTNEEINSVIRTLSKEKLATYFPVALKETAEKSKQDAGWISSHIPVVAGAGAGVLLVIIVIISCVVYRRVQNNKKYRKEEQTFVEAETLRDMDGQECVMIANPTYDSLYQRQTQA